jgi:GT2 family glycosyltransferase
MIERILVGIVLYNSRDDLPRCIEALRAQQAIPPLDIVCVDNASSDASADWVKQHAPEADLMLNAENVGFARAHNQILQHVQPGSNDVYLPLNPDIILAPDYIARLLDLLERTGAAYVSGKLLYPDGSIYSMGHALKRDGYAFNIGQGMSDDGRFEGVYEVLGVPAAAPLISGAFIRAIAPDYCLYDAGMFLYYEDVDLDWRTRLAGWRIYCTTEAVAWHRGGEPTEMLHLEALTNRYRSVLRNAFLYDLLLYNLPLIVLHCLIRLILTPKMGWMLCRTVARKGVAAFRARTPAVIPRREMLRWFRDAERQTSAMPITRIQRIRAFLRRRFGR